jgi:hypothetical protein
MAPNPLSNLGTYPSYHEVTGIYYDKEQIIGKIQDIDVQNLLLVIANLNNPSNINSNLIRQDFTEYLATKYLLRPVRQIL